MAVDEVDELVQEMSQHPASKSVPNSHETASLRDSSDTQRLLAENEEVCSKSVLKIEKLVPSVSKDFEAMVHENEVLRQKLQANKISLDDLPDFKPEKFSSPGVTEAIPTYTSESTLSSQNFQPRPGRRKSALGSSQAKKRKSSSGNEEESVEGVNGLLAVRPTTPQSRDMAEITEEELEKRQKKEQQKKDMEKIKNWSARNKSMQRSKSQDQLSTVASSAALGELTLDQQVEQEGKVFGSPEASKDEVRRALHKEDFSLNKYYKTSGWVQAIARSYIFEIFTSILIGVNCLWMSIDADLNKATLSPNADPLFQVAENLFCFGFTFELGIRFFALKRKKKCLKDAWFIFDAMLVISMIVEVWGVYLVMLLNGESVSVFQNATILRISRVLRLSRTARMAKILRTMPESMLSIKGIVVATRSVFFTSASSGIFIYVFSIIFIQSTRDTTSGDKYFTRFTESMLTSLLDAVSPDLSVFMREIIDEGAVVAIVMFVFILSGSVTMMNMLVGVLVEVIKTVSEIEREQMEVSFVKKIFSDMITKSNLDADGDNKISKDEFDTSLSKPEAAKALSNIGVDVVGLVDYRDVLFGKEGDVELSFAEFMEAILELRGTNNAKVKDIVDSRKFLSQETGAIYELVATVTAPDDDASSVSSFGHRAHSKRSASKINEEC